MLQYTHSFRGSLQHGDRKYDGGKVSGSVLFLQIIPPLILPLQPSLLMCWSHPHWTKLELYAQAASLDGHYPHFPSANHTCNQIAANEIPWDKSCWWSQRPYTTTLEKHMHACSMPGMCGM